MENQENQPPSFDRLKPASEEQLAAAKREEDARIFRELEGKANIPVRYAKSRLKEFVAHTGWGAVFAELAVLVKSDAGKLVVLCGKRGTGKSVMAIEVMRELMRARCYTFIEDLERYLRQVRYRDTDWTLVQERYEDPKLLVIDECAKISDVQWDQRLFFDIVNTRHKDNKHTILVCSVLPADLADFLGASLSDRVNEGGRVLHCAWGSFRKLETP